MKCPLGYKEYDGSPRATFEDTCEPCPAGYYGSDSDRAFCHPCRAGVVCKAMAITDQPGSNDSAVFGYNFTNSYPCPPGENFTDTAGYLPLVFCLFFSFFFDMAGKDRIFIIFPLKHDT